MEIDNVLQDQRDKSEVCRDFGCVAKYSNTNGFVNKAKAMYTVRVAVVAVVCKRLAAPAGTGGLKPHRSPHRQPGLALWRSPELVGQDGRRAVGRRRVDDERRGLG